MTLAKSQTCKDGDWVEGNWERGLFRLEETANAALKCGGELGLRRKSTLCHPGL